MAKEERVKIYLLPEDTSDNEFFSASDIGYHPRLMIEKQMLSSAQVNEALTRTMNDSFLEKITVAGKEDEGWQEQGRELVRSRESRNKILNEWMEKNGLLYYKNQLYIPEDQSL